MEKSIDSNGFELTYNNIDIRKVLIAAVKERPQLWDYKNYPPFKRTTIIKNKLWEEIEQKLNPNKENPEYTATFFKNKWKNLYDTYRSNLAKERSRGNQNGSKKFKTWGLANQMSFLKDNILHSGKKRAVSNLFTTTSLPKDDESTSESTDSDSSDENKSSTEYDKQNKKLKMEEAIDKIVASLNVPIEQPQIIIPSVPPTNEENDEIHHFCSTIKVKLQSFDKKKASLAMFKIYELLFKIENDLLD